MSLRIKDAEYYAIDAHSHLAALRGVGASKILFGSDHPYNPLLMEVEKIAKHVGRAAKLTEDDFKKVGLLRIEWVILHGFRSAQACK